MEDPHLLTAGVSEATDHEMMMSLGSRDESRNGSSSHREAEVKDDPDRDGPEDEETPGAEDRSFISCHPRPPGGEEPSDLNHSSFRAAEEEPPQKKLRSHDEDHVEIRFLVSSKEAGAIIGKGGTNINHLRKHYKSSVTVPDSPGPERVLSIVTSLNVLPDILREILSYDDPGPSGGQRNSEREVEFRLLIHTSHAGGIIGRGGTRIKDLRDETKAAIKVFSQCCPLSTERVCGLQGSEDVVIQGILRILDIILSTPVKGATELYDPFNFDTFLAPEYGGYPLEAGSGNHGSNSRRGFNQGPTGARGRGSLPPGGPRGSWDGWGHPPHAPMGPYGMGPTRRMGAGMGPPHAMYPSPHAAWMPPAPHSVNRRPQLSSSPVTHSEGPSTRFWSGPNNNSSSGRNKSHPPPFIPPAIHGWPHPQSTPVTDMQPARLESSNLTKQPNGHFSATLTVPNSVAGAIIGKGGTRIRIVRRDSGADISIDNSSGDRTIIIKGQEEQVRVAHSMLTMRLKKIEESDTDA